MKRAIVDDPRTTEGSGRIERKYGAHANTIGSRVKPSSRHEDMLIERVCMTVY